MKISFKLTSLVVMSTTMAMTTKTTPVTAAEEAANILVTSSSSSSAEESADLMPSSPSAMMSSFFLSAKELLVGKTTTVAPDTETMIPAFPVQVDVDTIVDDSEDELDNFGLDYDGGEEEDWVWTNTSSIPDFIDEGMMIYSDRNPKLMKGRFRIIVGGITANRWSGKDISVFDMIVREAYNSVHGPRDGIYLVNQRDEKIEISPDDDDDDNDEDDDEDSDGPDAVLLGDKEEDGKNSLRASRSSSRFYKVDATADFRCRFCGDDEDDDKPKIVKDPEKIAKAVCARLRKTNIRKFRRTRKCRILFRKKRSLLDENNQAVDDESIISGTIVGGDDMESVPSAATAEE